MSKKSKFAIWWNITAKGAQIATSISLVIIAFVTLRINSTTFQYNFRPYLSLSTRILPQLQEEFQIELSISNVGKVPANNYKIKLDTKSPGLINKIRFRRDETPPAVIFPDQKHCSYVVINTNSETIKSIIDNKIDFKIHLVISYDGIGTRNHKTEYFLFYNPTFKRLEIEGGRAI